MAEIEPNDDRDTATLLEVGSVGHGAVVGDQYDFWKVPIVHGRRYRVWTSLDANGGCEARTQDSGIGVIGGPFTLDARNDDIPSPPSLCSEAIVTATGDGVLELFINAWTPTLEYYLWADEL